jgi:PEGA domain
MNLQPLEQRIGFSLVSLLLAPTSELNDDLRSKLMKMLFGVRSSFSRLPLTWLPACSLVLFFCGASHAQATAEYAGATSAASATVASQPNLPKPGALATPPNAATDPNKPQHIASPSGPPPEVANRKALEERAGKSPCKLLLRSTPSAAQVFVDGAFVGESPLLLMVPPGKYRIEMRGHRLEFGQSAVDLLPRETREVALSLTTRYPTRVTMH